MAADSNARQERRRRIYVDADVQRVVLRHLVFCWLGILGAIASVVLLVESLKSGFTLSFAECLAAVWNHNATLLIALGALGPLLIWDTMRMTHGFTGPMVKFRRVLRQLGEGKAVHPIQFRKTDFWQDIAESFNLVLQRIEDQANDRETREEEAEEEEFLLTSDP